MSVRDLRLVGIADDGAHLLLAAEDGGRYRVPLDATLRSAVRHEPRQRAGEDAPASMSPREVQALIRAGASADEVAELSGWTREKISRYEGPIIAEREHVAGLATTVRLRHGSGSPLLAGRVAERLAERGVDPVSASWDSWRAVGSPWTLGLTFAAGGRLREARWHFDLATRSVEPLDDEARWLSGDDEPQALEQLVPTSAQRRVYDVESEGGIHSPEGQDDGSDLEPILAEPSPRRAHQPDEESDLVASVRERSSARRRSRKAPARGRRGAAAPPAPPAPATDPADLPEASPAAATGRLEEALADPVSPVSEIDAVVEALAPTGRVQAARDETPPLAAEVSEPALPQGGPVSEAALADPDEVADGAAQVEPAPIGAGSATDRATDAGADESAPDVATDEGAPDEEPQEHDGPAVEVERTEPKIVPVAQDDLPAEQPTRSSSGPTPEPQVERPDESAALADRTTGTTSQASGVDDLPAVEPGPAEHEPATDPAPQPNRAQRRAQQRRRSGRPSVPSWDDIMFGAKKDD